MSRILKLLGLRSNPTHRSDPLIEETIELRHSIDHLSENVRDLVVSVKRANRSKNPSRNPIEDMVRGRYRGVRDDGR
jgi:hypothetical protein